MIDDEFFELEKNKQVTDTLIRWCACDRELHAALYSLIACILQGSFYVTGWLAAFIRYGWSVFLKEWMAKAFQICGGACF